MKSGRHVLFNPGPVNLDPEIRRRAFEVELSHREPAFDELAERVRVKLHSASGIAESSHHLSLLHGSGTLAVDAALASVVRGRVLVIANGYYCERIATGLRGLGDVEVDAHVAGLGRLPDLDVLAGQIAQARPDWVAVVHHETSTGLLNPLGEIAALARGAGSRLFVDAVSSLGVHACPPDADVVCFNSNKCLESLPGIAGVFWSRELSQQPTLAVLELGRYAAGTPFTPNVQAFVALDIALDLLAAEDRPSRYRRLARRVWESGGASFEPLLEPDARSWVLTSFRLDGRSFDELSRRALDHGYVIYAGQERLRDEIFRVANMGAVIDEAIIDDLFAVLAP